MSGSYELVVSARKWTLDAMRDGLSVRKGMRRVIGQCSDASGDDVAVFQRLDWNASGERFSERLEECLDCEPPSEDIDGLWVGLFSPIIDGEGSMDCYLAGNPHFDSSDPDWACGPAYWPERRYFELRVLGELARVCRSDTLESGSWAEEALAEAFVALSLYSALMAIGPRQVSLRERVFGISYGFDSGDTVFFGRVDHGNIVLGTNAAAD